MARVLEGSSHRYGDISNVAEVLGTDQEPGAKIFKE